MGLIDKSKGRKIRGFYRLNQILKRKALYNIIMGQKSNGKTYSVLEYILKDYLKTGATIEGVTLVENSSIQIR